MTDTVSRSLVDMYATVSRSPDMLPHSVKLLPASFSVNVIIDVKKSSNKNLKNVTKRKKT